MFIESKEEFLVYAATDLYAENWVFARIKHLRQDVKTIEEFHGAIGVIII